LVYRWKAGYRATVSAQVAGERLDAIREAGGGHLTPAAVVADAVSAGSPLHPCFTWDDAEAARKRRDDEARGLIRSVCVLPAGASEPVLRHVNVVLPDVGHAYVTTERAGADEDLRGQVERDALAAIDAYTRRYRGILALAPIFEAIDRAAAEVAPRKARRVGRPMPQATA
jgi:hypothetical protein